MSPRALTGNAVTLLTGLAKFQATVQGARYRPKLLAQMLEAAPALESRFNYPGAPRGLNPKHTKWNTKTLGNHPLGHFF